MSHAEPSSGVIRLNATELIATLGIETAVRHYLDLLQGENQRVNLVSRETSREDLVRLVAQSLVPLAIEDVRAMFTESSMLLDIGSGGGFPAIPILIANQNLSGVLFERRQKKARALDRIVTSLDVRAKVLAEDFDHYDISFKFDLITIRYVTLTQKTLTQIRSVIAPGGAVLYYGITEPGLALTEWHVRQWRYGLTDNKEPQHLTVLCRRS
jgi:16S rRNA (guanine527-N7)-methyltransferase